LRVHSVNRIVKEGGVAAKLHAVQSFQHAEAKLSTFGWIELVDELYELFESSPFCAGESDSRDFWAAVTDQKKLFWLLKEFKHQCEREQRGEKTVLGMSSPELVQLLGQVSQEATDTADEKDNVDLFLWVGCCMHKEMNAFKAGVTEMEAWWAKNDIDPPIHLPNRDNDAASTLAPGTAAASHAHEKSKGGMIKVTTLAGTMFCHKDWKRGQQDTL
ncbi:hypothetical protein F5878DRAFT_647944, partial [Lentinula raphanica]